MLRQTPAQKAVRPALAPLDKSKPETGIFTETEVIFSIRPKPLSTIPSTNFCISSIGEIIFHVTPVSIESRSSSLKSLNGGPPAFVINMSGSGHLAASALCPSWLVISP